MKKNLSFRLRELRGGLSQSEFARKVGLKQTSYSGWESGAKVPAATAIIQISNAIGVSSDWILGLSDDRTGHAAPVADASLVARVAELEREADRLRAENAGLKYALDAISKGAIASARPTAQAIGA